MAIVLFIAIIILVRKVIARADTIGLRTPRHYGPTPTAETMAHYLSSRNLCLPLSLPLCLSLSLRPDRSYSLSQSNDCGRRKTMPPFSIVADSLSIQ